MKLNKKRLELSNAKTKKQFDKLKDLGVLTEDESHVDQEKLTALTGQAINSANAAIRMLADESVLLNTSKLTLHADDPYALAGVYGYFTAMNRRAKSLADLPDLMERPEEFAILRTLMDRIGQLKQVLSQFKADNLNYPKPEAPADKEQVLAADLQAETEATTPVGEQG